MIGPNVAEILLCEQAPPPYRGVRIFPLDDELAWEYRTRKLILRHYRRRPQLHSDGRCTLYRVDRMGPRSFSQKWLNRMSFTQVLIDEFSNKKPVLIPHEEWQELLERITQPEGAKA